MNILSRSRNIRDLLLSRLSNKIAAVALLLAAIAVIAVFFLLIQIFIPTDSKNQSTSVFTVETGQRSWNIASSLQEQGFIRSPASFMVYAILTGNILALQSGDYLLSPSMNTHRVVQKLSRGDVVSEYITIKEGWNLRDIAAEFEKKGFFTAEEFFSVTGYPAVDYRENTEFPKPKDFSREFSFLQDKPLYVSLEGYLFPDTYQITTHETPESFVRRALENFEANFTPLLEEIEAQEKTVFEVINWASLLEKEVRTFEDKKIVRGLLQKRIDNEIRLQTDAPVVYVREGNYYKVSIEETQIESPYNTYRVYGLPLGPIANPGMESMRAALEPEESPYWYYLSARDGTTVFSRTFGEHLAAKALYLR